MTVDARPGGMKPAVEEVQDRSVTEHEDDIDAHMGDIWQLLRTGEYTTGFPIRVGASLAQTADVLYGTPFWVVRPFSIDRLAVNVVSGVAGAARLGIYNDGTNLYPGALLDDAGTIDVTSTGVKTVTVAYTLTIGLYWLAIVSDVAETLTSWKPSVPNVGLGAALNDPQGRWISAFTYAALPDPFTASGGSDGNGSVVFARVSSLD